MQYSKNKWRYHVLAASLAVLLLGATFAESADDYSFDRRRGFPSQYDPGPAKNSAWARLFGSAPKYRAIGEFVLDPRNVDRNEKFRWKFGPMWYRGRLNPNEVKVFVVGQEGAQDENLSNRAFTGSTGTKTQKFLNHLGIQHSYLFLNTFVYTINGQLDHDNKSFKWLEQSSRRGEESPLVSYRHQLFNHMAETNPDTLQILLGVGSGGKASLATWVNANGGTCFPARNLRSCDTGALKRKFGLKNDLLVIGVPHPGGASPSNGGKQALDNIIRGFTNAARKVRTRILNDQNWADAWFDGLDELRFRSSNIDRIKDRLNRTYRYGDAPIPYQDFAFGTNWRMGARGTTSNRRNSGSSIQIFSDRGKYNNKGHRVDYRKPRDNQNGVTRLSGTEEIRIEGMGRQDVAYEPPKHHADDPKHHTQYDYGPCGVDLRGKPRSSCRLAIELQRWPDFTKLNDVRPASHPSFGHGPIYRGRLVDAEILILADQFSHDDFFSGRALTGEAGQRLQTFLKATGVGIRYRIIRTLPADTLNMDFDDVYSLASHSEVVEQRNRLLREVYKSREPRAILILGNVVKRLLQENKIELPEGLEEEEVFHLASPFSRNHIAEWNSVSHQLSNLLGSERRGEYAEEGRAVRLTAIPREDLPAGTRWWMGTTGTRAAKGRGNADVNGNYYKVWAPDWVGRLRARPLVKEERDEIITAMRNAGVDRNGRGEDSDSLDSSDIFSDLYAFDDNFVYSDDPDAPPTELGLNRKLDAFKDTFGEGNHFSTDGEVEEFQLLATGISIQEDPEKRLLRTSADVPEITEEEDVTYSAFEVTVPLEEYGLEGEIRAGRDATELFPVYELGQTFDQVQDEPLGEENVMDADEFYNR